ncbi:hypothetical protein RAMDARK_1424 [Rickettsia amblyommatis str. Darkwater]|nr:hypothetical protein RAMDARK_1424 [Rickettsia amblyommatis str. Darkwater]
MSARQLLVQARILPRKPLLPLLGLIRLPQAQTMIQLLILILQKKYHSLGFVDTAN